MDRLKFFVVCAVCSALPGFPANAAPPVHRDTPSHTVRWEAIIAEAAQHFGIPDAWIRGVMRAESGGRARLNGKPITSPKGAMGLMQVMPDTYRGLRARYGLGDDAYDPRDNIFAGAAYLRQMYERYGYPSLFAAYNAGPKRLDDFILHGLSLPRETLSYVGSIVPGAEIALLNSPNTVEIPSSERGGTVKPMPVFDTQDALFFTRKDADFRPDSRASGAPVEPGSPNSAAAFESTNNAALFVPLAGNSLKPPHIVAIERR